MKEKLLIGLVSIVGVVIVACGLVFLRNNLKPQSFGVYAGDSFNNLSSLSHTPTSTSAAGTLPVKVLSSNTNRVYAQIQNASATAAYLYFGSFDSALIASGSVSVTSGIYLAANGGSYEILPEKLYSGEVWVTSTLQSARILVSER